ncbi:MAG: endonuclease/exonuclease/phosphatase (EEP) superfamily protein YafD [Mariniblastus sp.]
MDHDQLGERDSQGLRLTLVVGVAMGGIVVTLMMAIAERHWLADLLVQLRVQCAIGLGAVAILLVLLKSWRWLGVCLIALLINLIPIWPYYLDSHVGSPRSSQATSSTSRPLRLRILSLNILTKNHRYGQVLDLIEAEAADFVVLLEVDASWETVLQPLSDLYPYMRFESRQDNFGIALLSKHAWSSLEVFHSEELQLPSIDAQFDALEGFPPLGQPLRIIGTHPIPPLGRASTEARNGQLLRVAKRFGGETDNLMVGDFNLTPWSPVFDAVLSAGQLNDTGMGFGVRPTWYVFPTWAGGLKIDHILSSQNIAAVNYRVGPDVGSDHRAVILDFRISN